MPAFSMPGGMDAAGGGLSSESSAITYRLGSAEVILQGKREPFTIREIGGRNIRELRHLRVTRPGQQVAIADYLLEQIDRQPSPRVQVAVPPGFVLPGGDFRTFREQQLAVADFSEQVRGLCFGIKAVMASARDILELEDALREEGGSYFGLSNRNEGFAIRTRDGLIVQGRHHLPPPYFVSRDSRPEEYLHGLHTVALIVPEDLEVEP